MTFELSHVLLAYLCIMLGLAAMIAFFHWWNEWRNPWKLPEDSLLQCPDCHCAFIVRRRSSTGRCPRCDRLCQVRRKK